MSKSKHTPIDREAARVELAALTATRDEATKRKVAHFNAARILSLEILGNTEWPIRPGQIDAAEAELAHLDAEDARLVREASIRATLDAEDGSDLEMLTAALREGEIRRQEMAQRIELDRRADLEMYAAAKAKREERARQRAAAGLPQPRTFSEAGSIGEIVVANDATIARGGKPVKSHTERRRVLAIAIDRTRASMELEALAAEAEAEQKRVNAAHEKKLKVAADLRAAEVAKVAKAAELQAAEERAKLAAAHRARTSGGVA